MSQRLKILHLTHDMGIGGTEQVIKQLITGLDQAKFDCQVLCLDGQIGPLGNQLQAQGIVIDNLHRQPGFDLALIKAIRDVLRIQQVDILHCHQYTPYFYGVLAAMFTNVRVIYTEHGRFHPDGYSWKRRVVNPLLNLATDSITTISEATRQALIHYEWFPARSIKVIYNGIRDNASDIANTKDRSSIELPDEAIVFGTIARLDSIKNHRMMLDSFSIVRKQRPDTRLLIVGDGPERDALNNHAQALGIESSVLFTGFQTDTPRFLAFMDVFLLSSFSEGTSMTLLEAMSFSKPCVATAVGGNIELLQHRESGLLSESGNSEDFANSMLEVLADSALKETLGRNARNVFLSKFELNYMIEAYWRLYADAENGKTDSVCST